jgi:hypothetical protein
MSGRGEELRTSNDELHRPFHVSMATANESETSDRGIRSQQVPLFDSQQQRSLQGAAVSAVTRLASLSSNNFNPGDSAANGGAARVPRLTSGVPIDAKNTLQSNSVVVAAVEPSLLDSPQQNQDFYKRIHGMSSLVTDRASTHLEDTESPSAEAIPSTFHHVSRAPISQLTEPPFTSACFVEDATTADTEAANALPIQAIADAETLTTAETRRQMECCHLQ